MPIYLKERQGNDSLTRKGIGANSLDLTAGATFLKRAGNIISQASATTDRIIGVNITEALFASDNQTNAKKEVKYLPKDVYALYRVTISGGAVTVANEGSFFNLSAADTVNGASVTTTPFYVNTSDAGAAVDPVLSMQLELVKFESSTQGWFRIVNL
jgi:hypothetical protein